MPLTAQGALRDRILMILGRVPSASATRADLVTSMDAAFGRLRTTEDRQSLPSRPFENSATAAGRRYFT